MYKINVSWNNNLSDYCVTVIRCLVYQRVYLVKQIPKNTDIVVSCLILTKVLLNRIILMPCGFTRGIKY